VFDSFRVATALRIAAFAEGKKWPALAHPREPPNLQAQKGRAVKVAAGQRSTGTSPVVAIEVRTLGF
jgi:hypothetical protein